MKTETRFNEDGSITIYMMPETPDDGAALERGVKSGIRAVIYNDNKDRPYAAAVLVGFDKRT